MIYTAIFITLFPIILLIKNWTNKYAWFFIVTIAGLDMMFFSSVLYIAKHGNYILPSNPIFKLDYNLYLVLSTLKFNYFNIFRIFNIGLSVFLLSIMLFVYEFTIIDDNKPKEETLKIVIFILLLPIFTVWFYDPNTSFKFHILSTNDINPPVLINTKHIREIIMIIDKLTRSIIILYLSYPFYLLYKLYKQTSIELRKKQIIALAISLMILNILFIGMFVLGPFKEVFSYFKGSSIQRFSSYIKIPVYYYNILPVIMLISINIMLFTLIKFHSIGYAGFITNYFIYRNTFLLNKNLNLRGVFHSFKNTMFMIKLLSEQLEINNDNPKQRELILKLQQVSNSTLNNINLMLNSMKEIKVRQKDRKLIDVLEAALNKVVIAQNITVVKNYYKPDVRAYFDFYHMTEAISNILQNSVEAIQKAERENGFIILELNTEQDLAIIRIKDNGCGIEKNNLTKIFNALFTTKSRQNNWGIGLTYVYRVIKANLGSISVKSEEGRCTTFEILLPRCREGK